MSSLQKYCLKWNDYHSSVTSVFEALRHSGELVDISLCCEGRTVKAHKILLSACSAFFRNLFKSNPCQHPVFFLKGPTFADLSAILEFIYRGEVNVSQEQLNSFLETAELLQVKGLSPSSEKNKSGGKCGESSSSKPDNSADTADSSISQPSRPLPRLTPRPPSPPQRQFTAFSSSPPPAKRRRSPPSTSLQDGVDEQWCSSAAVASPEAAEAEEERLADESSLDARMEQVEVETEEEEEEEENAEVLGESGEVAALPVGRHNNSNSNNNASSNSAGGASATSGGSGEWDSRRGAFRCPYCGRLYTHLVSLGQHLKVHQGDTTCHLCGKVLSRTTQLRIHLRQIHGVVEQPNSSNSSGGTGAVDSKLTPVEPPPSSPPA